MFELQFPEGAQSAKDQEQAMEMLENHFGYMLPDLMQLLEKVQMDFQSEKQKIMPALLVIPKEEYDRVQLNLEEKVVELNAASLSEEEIDFDSLLNIGKEDEKEDNKKKGKLYLPDPFGAFNFDEISDGRNYMQAFISIKMSMYNDKLKGVKIVGHDMELIAFLSCDIIPLRDFVKMTHFIQIKMNALHVLKNHHRLHAFRRCPECKTPYKDAVLSCGKCGFTKKLNQGVDNI